MEEKQGRLLNYLSAGGLTNLFGRPPIVESKQLEFARVTTGRPLVPIQCRANTIFSS